MDLLTDNDYDVIKSEYIKLYQDNTAIHFLAVNNEDRIIGCCGAFIKTDIPYCFFKQPSYGFIGDVYVVPEERRKWYAIAFIKESINHFLKYIASLLLFGSNGTVASFIMLDSYEIVLLRTLLGCLLLAVIFFVMHGKPSFYKKKKDFICLCVSGAAMGASWMFLYEAYAQIGVSAASLCYYSGPVIVMILSPLIFKEKLTSAKVIGFVCVAVGILLVNGQSASSVNMWGTFCGIMSAIMYSLMIIFNKKASEITGLENSTLQLTAAFLTVAAFVGIKQGFAMNIEPESILPILILGILNTGVGCYLYFSSIGRLSVQTVAICGYLEPLSAVLFSALILHEKMLPLQILGAVMIIGGAVFGEMAGKRYAGKGV